MKENDTVSDIISICSSKPTAKCLTCLSEGSPDDVFKPVVVDKKYRATAWVCRNCHKE